MSYLVQNSINNMYSDFWNCCLMLSASFSTKCQ